MNETKELFMMNYHAPASLPVLVIIAPEDFAEPELQGTVHALETAGFRYRVASTEVGPSHGMKGPDDPGIIYNVTHEIKHQRAEDYLAIAIIGGYGSMRHLWEDAPLRALVQQFDAEEKIIAAICVSPVILARAGVLQGKQATVWPDCEQALVEHGVTYQNQLAVTDGRFVTGQSPQASEAFGAAVVQALQSYAQTA
jgi:protease I